MPTARNVNLELAPDGLTDDPPDERATLAKLEANGWAADLDYDRRREAELSPTGPEPGCDLHGRPDCDVCSDHGSIDHGLGGEGRR